MIETYRSSAKKVVDVDATFLQDRSQSPLGDWLRVTNESRSPTARFMPPNLVASACLSVESEAEGAKFAGNLSVFEARQTSHHPTPIGIVKSSGLELSRPTSAGGKGSPCSRHDSAILRATS